jgi:nicotinate-nucleotide adenylyltransferase
VLLVPAYEPPHKEVEADPGVEHRVELCRLAVAGDPRFAVSRVEADVPVRSFTVDTLRRLHETHSDDELTFIVGGDMACSLPTWREPEAVLSLARLAVAERKELRRDDIARRLEPLHAGDRVVFFDMPRLDLSSSAIRARVADGRPIRYLVPGPVAEAIEARRLYPQAAGRPAA